MVGAVGQRLVAALVVACALWAQPAAAAIARVQTATAGTTTTSLLTLTATFGSSTTSGNTIVVCVRGANTGNNAKVSTVTDTLGTTYTLRASDVSRDPYMWVYTGSPASSGSNAVSVTFDATTVYSWVAAIEYSGVGSYQTANANIGAAGSTDLQSASLTTSAAGLVVMAGSQNNLATYSAGTDFTFLTQVGGDGYLFGGVEEYITSGALSGYTAHLTSSVTDQWTAVTVAFAAAGGGGGGSFRCNNALTLLGVGCGGD